MNPLLVVADASHVPAELRDLGIDVEVANALPAAADVDRDRPTAVVLPKAWRDADPVALRALASRAAIVVVGAPGEAQPPNGALAELAVGWLPNGADPQAAAATLRGALLHAGAVSAGQARHDELSELTRIGVALSTERDLTTLLNMILSQARRLVSADAGSLYLVERHAGEAAATMRFTLLQNDTLPDLPFRERTMAINARSLAGYVAVSGKPLVIDDVYEIGADVPYIFNRSFDEQVAYRTQSVLVIPMRSHRDEVVGVLQLINRKRDADVRLSGPAVVEAQVIPFDEHSVALVSALASQAAVAIENSRLYQDIEALFEGFVKASVHTIEQRDPTTSGHSSRVTYYTMGLADALNRGVGRGAYADTRFTKDELRELNYACLLHDFGKVTVREAVLQKAKKLYTGVLENVRHRFSFMAQCIDLASERERADYLRTNGTLNFEAADREIEARRQAKHAELKRMLDVVLRANEPSIMPEGTFDDLQAVAAHTFIDETGMETPLLSDEELRFLSIRRGNLDDRERKEIESHASQSYAFLTRIPWTSELRNIPEIVWGHHEKLNGRGYPRGIGAPDLRLQTRMMTISDIYDALTAADRPYKKAVTNERAIAILREEAREGALDHDLLETFIEARVWEAVASQVAETNRDARQTGAVPVRVSGER
ncbi:MAG TPA: HD domain-containing phosphohydrolase [Gemmatimonadaceae bacterium]|nr:HD domain-containing phosphohydrolase [Gemmatimonadaceae bacterium]